MTDELDWKSVAQRIKDALGNRWFTVGWGPGYCDLTYLETGRKWHLVGRTPQKLIGLFESETLPEIDAEERRFIESRKVSQ